jgi:ketosteroid isomerase-like protein
LSFRQGAGRRPSRRGTACPIFPSELIATIDWLFMSEFAYLPRCSESLVAARKFEAREKDQTMNTYGSENTRLIKNFYRGLSQNDWNLARSVLDEDIEWDEPLAPDLWFGGHHFGLAEVFKDVLEPAYDRFRKLEFRMRKFFSVGDKVFALGHARGRSEATNIVLDAPLAHIWTIANGKAIRFQGFHDLLEWRIALGLTSVQDLVAA